MYIHSYTHIDTDRYMYIYICTDIDTDTHIDTDRYMYIHKHTHRHIHTHIGKTLYISGLERDCTLVVRNETKQVDNSTNLF